MRLHEINIPDEALAELCQRYGVTRLSVFGSILRPDFGPASDVDILVEFPSGQTPSLLDLGGLLMELREMIGREVDLKTPGFLSPPIYQRVAREARTLYAA